jgi:solute carrier family 25 carnitine/acylcarnitine transporter 20/29
MFAGESFALSFLDPKWKHGNEGHDNSALNFFMAGSFGGMLQCLVLVPADVVKCKMQVMTDYRGGMRKRNAGANSNNPTEVPSPSSSTSTIRSSNEAPRHISSLECLTNVYKTEGLRGLYRGLGVTAIREVPAFGVYFFVYRYTVRLLNSPKDPKEQQHLPTIIESPSGSVTDFSDEQCEPVDSKGAPSALSILISGGLAGSISWICIYPFDVIKSHVQIMTPSTSSSVTAIGNKCSATVKGNNNGAVAASSAAKSESSAIAMALKLYRQHGIKVFFRGLGVTIVRAFPVNAMTFYMYELIKTKLMK